MSNLYELITLQCTRGLCQCDIAVRDENTGETWCLNCEYHLVEERG